MTPLSKPSVHARGFLFVPLLFALGCGRTAEVTGKATLDGKPITSGSVTFLAANSLTYSGDLNEQGVYRILNVPRGNAKVAVASPDPSKLASGQDKATGNTMVKRFLTTKVPTATPASWFPVPADYADFEKSGLQLEVRGGVNTFDIPLADTKAKK
jgi:hypothetical protein